MRVIPWDDIPEHERVTEAFLRQCPGASDGFWLERQIRNLDAAGCQAAVAWYASKPVVYAPCRRKTAPGVVFCFNHGGAKRPVPPRETLKAKLLRKATARRVWLEARVVQLEATLAEVRALIAAIEHDPELTRNGVDTTATTI